MKRPVGVILTSILLGLIALVQLLVAAGMGFGAYAIASHGPATYTSANPATPAPPAIVMTVFIGVFAGFLALLAAWAIVTLIGLIRLRNWARYSILVIGGCMAAFGLVSSCGSVLMAAMGDQFAAASPNPPPPGLPPHLMQGIFLVTALFYGLIAVIGIAWLIYFNLRGIKISFTTPTIAYSDATLPPPTEFPTTPPAPRTPVAIVVLACLFLLGAFSCLIVLLLPFPAFLFGFIVTGPTVKIVYILLALLNAAIGIGLLRRDNRARLATYGLVAVGGVNLLLIATPWYRANFQAYSLEITRSFTPAWVLPTPPIVYSGPMLAFSALIGIVIYAAVLWILHRYRATFE